MPSAFIYAYPWDVEDEGALQRVADVGVSAVVVAASYHATRAATPHHPRQALVDAKHAACYVPVRESAWRGRRLVPRTPTWTADADSFGAARDRLATAGVATHAWLVLTHNSALGADHDDLAVENAFGDRYSYALCPSADDVAEYCTTLADEVLLAGPVDGLVLEACGPMGFDHNGLHEKTGLSDWTTVQRDLLSLCFCVRCSTQYAHDGLDVARIRADVRGALRRPPLSAADALGGDVADALLAVRRGAIARLTTLVRERAVRHGARVAVHLSSDPWATGSFAAPTAPALGAEAVVARCLEPEAEDELVALRGLAPKGTALGAFVSPNAAWHADETRLSRMETYRGLGVEELHLYHLGLAGPRSTALLKELRAAFAG